VRERARAREKREQRYRGAEEEARSHSDSSYSRSIYWTRIGDTWRVFLGGPSQSTILGAGDPRLHQKPSLSIIVLY